MAQVATVREGRAPSPRRAIVLIGFMGGNVHATNLIHREATVAQELQQRYPLSAMTDAYAELIGLMIGGRNARRR